MRYRDPGDDDEDAVDLSPLDRDFAAAPLPAQVAPLPDGHYRVQVVHVEITTARSTRCPILKWKLRVRDAPFAGRLLWKNSVLASPVALRWLKHDLHLCGLVLDKLSDLPEQIHHLLDVELDVTKRTQAQWENVHFNRRLPAEPTGAPPF
jgi:hypothetical protein